MKKLYLQDEEGFVKEYFICEKCNSILIKVDCWNFFSYYCEHCDTNELVMKTE